VGVPLALPDYFYDSIRDVKLNTDKNKNLCTFYDHNAGQDCVLRVTNQVFENTI